MYSVNDFEGFDLKVWNYNNKIISPNKSLNVTLSNRQYKNLPSIEPNLVKQKKLTFYVYIRFKNISNATSHHCVKSVHIWSYSGQYSVQMWENTDQNNSEYRNFSRISAHFLTIKALSRVKIAKVDRANKKITWNNTKNIPKRSLLFNYKLWKSRLIRKLTCTTIYKSRSTLI